MLGLVGHDAGTVAWNGVPVDDLSTWMVPPRVAYVPQVPRLFSEPLADTILLGLGADGLEEAIDVAALTDDVADMPQGLATVVGPKGVRLSGGQVQRTAAARALVRRPELLVVDDLSSALDVTTEARLWERLLAADDGMTLVVVSHRRFLLDRADQVITLRAGRRR
jgi:ATP-binding cassette subfamily B protein